jgi:AcrR family transcriptional regulator
MSTQTFSSEIREQSSSERALISTAINLLIKHQEKPISVSQLIRAAGVSRSSFYKYFASREDLYAAILLTEEFNIGPLLSKIKVYGTVSDLLEAFLNYCIQNIEKYKLLAHIEQNLENQPETIERYEQWKLLRAEHVDEFTRIVQSRLSKSKNMDSENIRFYYGLVWSIAMGVAQLSDSDFYHKLIVDRRGFSKFLLESVATIGDAK